MDVARHVADQRRAGIRDHLQLRARNRLVRADVAVDRAGRPLELVVGRHARGDVLLAVGHHVHGADHLRLLERLVRPRALVGVVGGLVLAEEIHRDHRELHRRAALDEADRPVVVQAAQLLERGDRLLMDGVVVLAAVGHLHHGHAAALVIDEFLLRILENFQRQHGRPGREVVYTRHDLCSSWLRKTANILLFRRRFGNPIRLFYANGRSGGIGQVHPELVNLFSK